MVLTRRINPGGFGLFRCVQNLKFFRSAVSLVLAFVVLFTSIAPAYAKNFNTWEELDSHRQGHEEIDPYEKISDIGAACVESSGNKLNASYASLAAQMFVLPAPPVEGTADEFWNYKKLAPLKKEIDSFEPTSQMFESLESEATKNYFSQLVYSWMIQKEVFQGSPAVNLIEFANESKIIDAFKIASNARKSQKKPPSALDPDLLQKHIKVFNNQIRQINEMCSDAHTLYVPLMKVYNKKNPDNPFFDSDFATVEYILEASDSGMLINGGTDGAIRDRIQRMRTNAAWEAGIHKAIMSWTMFGKMYAVGTPLSAHVGTFSENSCVEHGKQLKELPTNHDEIWKILGNSYAQLDTKFRESLRDGIKVIRENSPKDILKEYVQSNPGSIQQAMITNPSRVHALTACDLVHEMETKAAIKQGIAELLAPVALFVTFATLGSASGLTASIIAYSALAFNLFFIGSTIINLSLSYDLEDRLNAGILSDQIDQEAGQGMIEQLQSARPFSYLNLALSGLGAAVVTQRIAQINKMNRFNRFKRFLDGEGGLSYNPKGGGPKNPFWGGGALRIKLNPLNRASLSELANKVRVSPNKITGQGPKGVKHDLGADKLRDYLKFAQNEANAGTGIVKTGPNMFIKPTNNSSGIGSGGGYPKGGLPSGGKPSYAGQRPSYGSQPVTQNPKAVAVAQKPNATTNRPINQIQINQPATSPSTTALIPQTQILVAEEELEPEPDPNVAPMPAKPDVVVPPVWPRIVESPEAPGNNGRNKNIIEGPPNIPSKIGQVSRGRHQAEKIVQGLAVFDLAYLDAIIEISRQGGELGRLASELIEKYQKEQKERYWYSIYYYASLKQELENIEKQEEAQKKTEAQIISDLENGNFHVYDFPKLFLLAHGESETAQNIRKILGMQRTSSGHIRINVTQMDPRLGENLTDDQVRQFKQTLRFQQTMMDVNMINHFRTIGKSDLESYIGLVINSEAWAFIQKTPIISIDTYRKYFHLHYNGSEKSDLGALLNWYPAEVIFSLPEFMNLHSRVIERMRVFTFGMLDDRPKPVENIITQSVGDQSELSSGHYNGSANLFIEGDVNSSMPERDSPSSITTSSDTASSDRIQEKYTFEISKEFDPIDQQYNDMLKNLRRRDELYDDFMKAGLIDSKTIERNKLEHQFFQFQNESSTEFSEFNEITQRIKTQNQFLVTEIARVIQKYGFNSTEVVLNDGVIVLEIIPTEKSSFHRDLIRMTKYFTSDPLGKYKLIFNPIYLHNYSALLGVSKNNEVLFGLHTVKLLVLNEVGVGGRHEMRHLYYNLLREKNKYSIYHQDYTWEEGMLVNGKTYQHFLSAEEIPAYANNLKIGIEEFRMRFDEDNIDKAIDSLFHVSKGILSTSNEFLTTISNNQPFILRAVDREVPEILVILPSKKQLRKYMVTDEERELFGKYNEDKNAYYDEIIDLIYREQQKLNHIAYRQVVGIKELQLVVDRFGILRDETIGKKSDEVDLHFQMNQTEYELLIKKIINQSVALYQSSKESRENITNVERRFTTNVEKMDDDEEFWPLVVLGTFNAESLRLNHRNITIDDHIAHTTSSPITSTHSESNDPNIIHLYKGTSRLKNYSNSIINVKKGQVLDFGNGETFVVEKYIGLFGAYHLVSTQDWKTLRIPAKEITSPTAFHAFMENHNRLKSLGIPVLEILQAPKHARYVLHEELYDPYLDIRTLTRFQVEKDDREYSEIWSPVKEAIEVSIVMFAQKTFRVASLDSFNFDQVAYSFSRQSNQHEWKIVVSGKEAILEYDGKSQGSIFNGENRLLFHDEVGSHQKIADAILNERIAHPVSQIEVSSDSESIQWLKKHIPGFKNYYNENVQLSDHSFILSQEYYFEKFYEILKSRPDLVVAFDQDVLAEEFEKIVKQLVDEVDPEQYAEIVTSRGHADIQMHESESRNFIRNIYQNLQPAGMPPPDFIYQVMRGERYEFSNQHFRMNIVPGDAEFHLLYNDEHRRNELNVFSANVALLSGQNNDIDTKDTEIYKFQKDDVRISEDQKFVLIRTTSDKIEETYFLFIRDAIGHLYAPYGKINRYNHGILQIDSQAFAWFERAGRLLGKNNDQSGQLENIETVVKQSISSSVEKMPDAMRLYVNDPALEDRFGIFQNVSGAKYINYGLLYGYRSNSTDLNHKRLIVVLDTKYYSPSMNRDRFFIYNPEGYEVYAAQMIDGTKYVFIRDRQPSESGSAELVSREPMRNTVVPTVTSLANDASRRASAAEDPSIDEVQAALAPQPFLPGSIRFSNTEILAAHSYFDSLEGNKKNVWQDVRVSQIKIKKYQEIDFDTVVALLHQAHITGNKTNIFGSPSREKLNALIEAKQFLIKLGFDEEDADSIIRALAKANILGESAPQAEASNNPNSVYGDEQFLDHLKFEVEDISESRQNPIALFRGISTFYKNTGVTQEELEIFTRWVADHFSFAPFWGRNKYGNDWGFSYLQMWPKASFAKTNIGIQFDLVFLVNKENLPFVVVRLPGHQKEVLYGFKDLVSHIDQYILSSDLVPGHVYPESTYYSLITGAQYDTTEKTAWERDEYEDVPAPPAVQFIPVVDNRNPGSDHVQFHTHEPNGDRIKNLGEKNSSASELMQNLIDQKVTAEQLLDIPTLNSGRFQSTRIFKLSPKEEFYFKTHEEDMRHKPFTDEVYDYSLPEYNMTDLEFAVYLADQKLTKRYAKSYLIEVDGKKFFFTKKENQLTFNYTNAEGRKYVGISKESMDSLYLYNYIARSDFDRPQTGMPIRGAIKFNLPEEIILFDFLFGIVDRSLSKNIALVGEGTFDYVKSNKPLEIPEEFYKVIIYDGGYAFQFNPKNFIKGNIQFTNWFSHYFYNGFNEPLLNPHEEIKKLIFNNPDFVNQLSAWTEDQIKNDLRFLSESHLKDFLRNRQFILDVAFEAGFFAPSSASKN